MKKRYFKHYPEAEDFANDLVFGGDDPTVQAELVEVWPDHESYDHSFQTGAWGDLYVVWGAEDEVDQALEALGEWTDKKGRVERS
jgi:hypothetical protein